MADVMLPIIEPRPVNLVENGTSGECLEGQSDVPPADQKGSAASPASDTSSLRPCELTSLQDEKQGSTQDTTRELATIEDKTMPRFEEGKASIGDILVATTFNSSFIGAEESSDASDVVNHSFSDNGNTSAKLLLQTDAKEVEDNVDERKTIDMNANHVVENNEKKAVAIASETPELSIYQEGKASFLDPSSLITSSTVVDYTIDAGPTVGQNASASLMVNDNAKEVADQDEPSPSGSLILGTLPLAGSGRDHQDGFSLEGSIASQMSDLPNGVGDSTNNTLLLHGSSHDLEEPYDDASKGQGQDTLATSSVVVTGDMEGWHRFDVGEPLDMPFSTGDSTPNQLRQLELWEQLLEDGLEDREKERGAAPSHDQITNLLIQEHHLGYNSPGNPFIDGLDDRMSNFSESEGFATIGSLQNPAFPLESLAVPQVKGGASGDEKEQAFSGLPSDVNVVESGPELGISSSNELKPDQNLQVLAVEVGPLAEAVEPYEPPSFMSLVDPESHALFEASMPTYHLKTNVSAHKGDAWEADFDLMAPSSQVITRGSSLPRVEMGAVSADGIPARESTARSGGSLTPATSPKSRGSVLWSPKLSPMVKKIVYKVRSMPGSSGNEFHEAMKTTQEDDTIKPKSLWARCMCC